MPETANPSHTGSICRYLLALIGMLVPLAISCTNSRRSDQVTYQITSGSMAPTYWGPSYQAVCQSCGHTWRVCAETTSSTLPSQCDICGGQVQVASQIQAGDILQATKVGASYSPARFDCIVFKKNVDAAVSSTHTSSSSDASSESWNCKRIWGLPGEKLQVERGELFVDGKLFQKSYDQLRRLCVEVSRIDSQASPGYRSDWRIVDPNQSKSSRTFDLNRFILRPGQNLQFHHASNSAPQSSSVFDDYSQNLTTPRNLKVVDDLVFDFEFEFPAEGLDQHSIAVDFTLDYLKQRFQFQFKPTITPATTLNEKDVVSCGLTIAAWDGLVAIVQSKERRKSVPTTDGESTAGLKRLEPTSESNEQSGRTTLVVSCSTTCSIASATVFRDVYLRMDERDDSNHTENQVTVPSGHYFVIGDNFPISQDSRNGLGMVHRDQIQAILSNR